MASADELKLKGNEHFKTNEFEKAAAAYTEAIALRPDECTYWLNRSNAYRQLLRWADAEQDAAKALELDPTNTKAAYGRALCLRKLQRLAEAFAACEAGLGQGENKALQQLRNELLHEQKQQEAAETKAKAKAAAPPPSRRSASNSSSSSSSSDSSREGDWGGQRRGGRKKEVRAVTEEELPMQQLGQLAQRGDLEACSELLGSGRVANVNWKRPKDGNTALHLAADAGHVSVVEVLLAGKADPESSNDFLLSPFALAAHGSETERLLKKLTKPLGDERRGALKM